VRLNTVGTDNCVREQTLETLRVTWPGDRHHPGRGSVPSETGLDDETIAAIERVWAASPHPSPRLVDAARAEFAAMSTAPTRARRRRMEASFKAALRDEAH
jgi:hypothetical protein